MLPYWNKKDRPAAGSGPREELDRLFEPRLEPVPLRIEAPYAFPGPVVAAASAWSDRSPQSDPAAYVYPIQAPGARCCIFIRLNRDGKAGGDELARGGNPAELRRDE